MSTGAIPPASLGPGPLPGSTKAGEGSSCISLGSWRRHSGEARPVGSEPTTVSNKTVAFCGGGRGWGIGLQTVGEGGPGCKRLALSPGWSRTLWAGLKALGTPGECSTEHGVGQGTAKVAPASGGAFPPRSLFPALCNMGVTRSCCLLFPQPLLCPCLSRLPLSQAGAPPLQALLLSAWPYPGLLCVVAAQHPCAPTLGPTPSWH